MSGTIEGWCGIFPVGANLLPVRRTLTQLAMTGSTVFLKYLASLTDMLE